MPRNETLLPTPTGKIASMGWKKDEETGEEVFYAEVRFDGIPPLSPKLVWEAIPVNVCDKIAEETSSDAALIRDLNTLAAAHASGPNDDGHVIAQAAAKIVELRMQIDKMLRDEREACAAVAEKFFPPEMDYKWDEAGRAIASAIRDRTQR
jgi:hypothetical protein